MAKISTGADLNPSVEIKTSPGAVVVTVGNGYYEIYIDQKMQQPALNYNLTHEYPAEPGEHRVGVYSAGRFIFDQMITVPAEEEAAPEEPAKEPDHPEEQPAAQEPEKTVAIKASIIRDLIAEMRDIAALLDALLACQEAD